jgi:hypothetical protein
VKPVNLSFAGFPVFGREPPRKKQPYGQANKKVEDRMKAQILYETKSKYNEKIAEALSAALDIPMADAADKPVLEDVDTLFIVGVGDWFDDYSSPFMLSYLKNQKSRFVRRAALITTCHTYDGRQNFVRKLLTEKDVEVIGERVCLCRRFLSQMGHPNKNDRERVLDFMRGILGLPRYEK